MKSFYEWFNKEVDTSNMTGDEAEEAEAASHNAWNAAKELYQPKWWEIYSCPEITDKNHDSIVISPCGLYWIELPELPR